MTRKTYVIGVGMTKFERPKPLVEYTDLGKEAVTKALNDAKLDYKAIQVQNFIEIRNNFDIIFFHILLFDFSMQHVDMY